MKCLEYFNPKIFKESLKLNKAIGKNKLLFSVSLSQNLISYPQLSFERISNQHNIDPFSHSLLILFFRGGVI